MEAGKHQAYYCCSRSPALYLVFLRDSPLPTQMARHSPGNLAQELVDEQADQEWMDPPSPRGLWLATFLVEIHDQYSRCPEMKVLPAPTEACASVSTDTQHGGELSHLGRAEQALWREGEHAHQPGNRNMAVCACTLVCVGQMISMGVVSQGPFSFLL